MDFFKEYKKNKRMNNFTIIGISLILALAINFGILNPNFLGKNMKANILENHQKENIADIFLEKKDDKIILKTNGNIKNISSLSLSLIYNSDNLEVLNIIPRLNSTIDKLSDENGIKTIIINYKENYNIKSGENILSFGYKKNTRKTENINIINSNFTNSNGQTFELTNNGISF